MTDELAVELERIDAINPYKQSLSELLVAVVDDGASIGFLPPLAPAEAEAYWEGVSGPDVVLYIARIKDKVVGTVQLQLCGKKNGSHRAEVAKLMTHPAYRRHGIGRLLMKRMEEEAELATRSLLVLDTREGDASNRLYQSLGYMQAGRIPGYARSADGSLDATIFYYKNL